MGCVPLKYKWLEKETGPKVLLEAIKHYGLLEVSGKGNNPDITNWSRELGGTVGKVYTDDSIPWCGLFVAMVVKRAGYTPVTDPLWALNWLKFGNKVTAPMLGDIVCFVRPGGGHVGFYVGEDKECYHILGGNQSDSVSVTRIEKSRAKGFRRCPFKLAQPENIRKIYITSTGTPLSIDEA